MTASFDTRYRNPADFGAVDSSVITAAITGATTVASAGIAASSKHAKHAKDAAPASVPPPPPPAPSPSVPGWAIGLGALSLVVVAGAILLRSRTSPPIEYQRAA